MPASLASLARRIAKIEKDRGLTGADGLFNRLLVGMGEPTCANEDQAFLVILKRMNDQTLPGLPKAAMFGGALGSPKA